MDRVQFPTGLRLFGLIGKITGFYPDGRLGSIPSGGTVKRCYGCSQEKSLADFNRSARTKDGCQPQCRACQAAYFVSKRARIMPLVRARKAKIRRENRALREEFLSSHPCVDCGEADPVVLDFDHVRGEKLADVARLIAGGYEWAKVKSEIEKCEVRCANCHRRITHKRRRHASVA